LIEKNTKNYRAVSQKSLVGIIPTTFGGLTALTTL